MSAHCNTCGSDLPLEGPCHYCTLKAHADELDQRLCDYLYRGYSLPTREGYAAIDAYRTWLGQTPPEGSDRRTNENDARVVRVELVPGQPAVDLCGECSNALQPILEDLLGPSHPERTVT